MPPGCEGLLCLDHFQVELVWGGAIRGARVTGALNLVAAHLLGAPPAVSARRPPLLPGTHPTPPATCLPSPQGNRTPHTDALSRGAIAGLTLRHGRGHLFRALIEAICFGTEHIFETMRGCAWVAWACPVLPSRMLGCTAGCPPACVCLRLSLAPCLPPPPHPPQAGVQPCQRDCGGRRHAVGSLAADARRRQQRAFCAHKGEQSAPGMVMCVAKVGRPGCLSCQGCGLRKMDALVSRSGASSRIRKVASVARASRRTLAALETPLPPPLHLPCTGV